MLPKTKLMTILSAIFGVMTVLPAVANALDVDVAEVRGDSAYVAGSGAGRKQEIFWDVGAGPVLVTKANPKGNFSFEGALPAGCPPSDCTGMLSAGGVAVSVPIDYQVVEPVAELTLVASATDAHRGSPVRAVGFFADGRVVSGGEDASLRGWEIVETALEPSFTQALDHIIYDLAVWTHRPVVITGEGGWNGSANSDTLRVYDDDLQSMAFGITAPIGYIYTVEVAPGPAPLGTLLYPEWTVASGFYGEIAVYRTDGLLPCATKATKKKRTKALKFSSDASILASTSTSSRIQVWSFDAATCDLELQLSLSHSGSWHFPIDFAPGSTNAYARIVSGTDGGSIKVWTIENWAMSNVRSVDSGAVYALDWSPNGDMIVAAGGGDITVYDSTELSVLFHKSDAHRSRVNDVAFYVDPTTDEQWIVSGGADGDLKLWRVPTPAP